MYHLPGISRNIKTHVTFIIVCLNVVHGSKSFVMSSSSCKSFDSLM